jgi:hypothetical protein
MPRMPDLASGYGVNRDTLPGSGHLEAEGWFGRCPAAGTIVRYGMSRLRRLRGDLVKRNLVTDSPGGRVSAVASADTSTSRIAPVLTAGLSPPGHSW